MTSCTAIEKFAEIIIKYKENRARAYLYGGIDEPKHLKVVARGKGILHDKTSVFAEIKLFNRI